MIAPAIEERSATRWYEIRGWRGPQPALLRMPSPLLLGFARGIIADELRMLGPRLDELDRGGCRPARVATPRCRSPKSARPSISR